MKLEEMKIEPIVMCGTKYTKNTRACPNLEEEISA